MRKIFIAKGRDIIFCSKICVFANYSSYRFWTKPQIFSYILSIKFPLYKDGILYFNNWWLHWTVKIILSFVFSDERSPVNYPLNIPHESFVTTFPSFPEKLITIEHVFQTRDQNRISTKFFARFGCNNYFVRSVFKRFRSLYTGNGSRGGFPFLIPLNRQVKWNL